jgi:hypothetical protein
VDQSFGSGVDRGVRIVRKLEREGVGRQPVERELAE